MTTSEFWTADDESRIDRLVDGGIGETERRALLAQFELEPDGWRRCALAFLEAQAWREAVRPASHAAERRTAGAAASHVVARRDAPPSRTGRNWRLLAPLAASCLAVYSLGWLSADGARSLRERTTTSTVIVGSPRSRPASRGEVAVVPSVSARPKPGATHRAPPASPPAVLAARRPQEGNRIASAGAPSPESLRRDLEQRGFQVETRRGVVTLPLKNGRHVAIPVGAMKVRYAGARTI